MLKEKKIKKCKILYIERKGGCEIGVWYNDGSHDPSLVAYNARLDFNEADFIGKTPREAMEFFGEEFQRQMAEMSKEERERILREDERCN